ncbi:mas-related G-protein coupled receptor member A2-like [Erinaceus europaeus]|uniref:Mas-related G-protein coupled receptor member A2-like n=1 Tax=Erinaceus europaeus TaxID=9365 RepID=A0A1S3AJ61_ERIEU|nr:mas-related G-protein coupled receptor member A2-like [Erinaceus europaeus]
MTLCPSSAHRSGLLAIKVLFENPKCWLKVFLQECESSVVTDTSNATARARNARPLCHFYHAVYALVMVVGLLGLLGNGAVVWLLGFRVQRTPFSVYILNLACADFLFLLGNIAWLTIIISSHHLNMAKALVEAVKQASLLASVCLLMAVSTQRCVSVPYPVWYRCHRPAHLSSAVCALIWVLASCSGTLGPFCSYFASPSCHRIYLFYYVVSLLTSLVLCASSLALLLRVRCGSGRRRPGRLYLTIALSVLAFLLLGLPLDTVLVATLYSDTFPYFDVLLPTLYLLSILNSVVNPLIYFFVGRYRQPRGHRPLREVLQSALTDEEERDRQRGAPSPRLEVTSV